MSNPKSILAKNIQSIKKSESWSWTDVPFVNLIFTNKIYFWRRCWIRHFFPLRVKSERCLGSTVLKRWKCVLCDWQLWLVLFFCLRCKHALRFCVISASFIITIKKIQSKYLWNLTENVAWMHEAECTMVQSSIPSILTEWKPYKKTKNKTKCAPVIEKHVYIKHIQSEMNCWKEKSRC